jgi:hypothetical protein
MKITSSAGVERKADQHALDVGWRQPRVVVERQRQRRDEQGQSRPRRRR